LMNPFREAHALRQLSRPRLSRDNPTMTGDRVMVYAIHPYIYICMYVCIYILYKYGDFLGIVSEN
jgi:hypothetical protein